MADVKPQQEATSAIGAVDTNDFDSLLKKEFKPKTDEAKDAVERAGVQEQTGGAELLPAHRRAAAGDGDREIRAGERRPDRVERVHGDDLGDVDRIQLRMDVVHLHGGHVPARFDGLPEYAILPGAAFAFWMRSASDLICDSAEVAKANG